MEKKKGHVQNVNRDTTQRDFILWFLLLGWYRHASTEAVWSCGGSSPLQTDTAGESADFVASYNMDAS